MMRKIAFLLALLAFFVVPAFAALEVQVDNTVVGGSVATRVNFEGDVTGSGYYGDKTITIGIPGSNVEEVSATRDALAASESGKIIIYKYDATTFDDNTYVILPALAATSDTVPMRFSFVNALAGNKNVDIDPMGTDKIFYETCGAGTTLASPSGITTGDSITLLGIASGWYVIEIGDKAWVPGS